MVGVKASMGQLPSVMNSSVPAGKRGGREGEGEGEFSSRQHTCLGKEQQGRRGAFDKLFVPLEPMIRRPSVCCGGAAGRGEETSGLGRFLVYTGPGGAVKCVCDSGSGKFELS